MNTPEILIVERRGAHLWLRLNRPEKANALSVALMEGGAAALRQAASDDSVSAILLTGAGERVFCAGADVREKPADGDMLAHRKRRSAGLAAIQDAIIDCPKPVIAVLNGIASGGGAMLAFLADARVAVDTAALTLPEIDIPMPTFIGAAIVEHVAGTALAADLVQTGRRMPVSEAAARGLMNAVVPRAELEAVATSTATAFAGKDARAFAAQKEWLGRRLKAALIEARAAQAGYAKH
jgi:enoyl-CoA hydratase/carnithine racemase